MNDMKIRELNEANQKEVVVGEVETMSRLLLCFDTSTIGGTLFEIQSGENGKASGWEMKKVVSKVYGNTHEHTKI
jgi:hypothetical protein